MTKAIIHVNQHFIKANTKDGKNRPVFSIKVGDHIRYSNVVVINGPSALVYNTKGLDCGAKAYIVTDDSSLDIASPMTWEEAKNVGNGIVGTLPG